jgi:hypothetical protein
LSAKLNFLVGGVFVELGHGVADMPTAESIKKLEAQTRKKLKKQRPDDAK